MLDRILLIHNYYQHRGGEDSVFEAEVELLRSKGHIVDTLTFSNDTIQSRWEQFKVGLLNLNNPFSAKLLREKIKQFQPDLIHIHNFFPIGSPSLLLEAKKHRLPVVMTLHNFRLICPNALLYRNGTICESCVEKPFPIDGIFHGCYRDSRLQTTALATMSIGHRIAGTWQNAVNQYITLNPFSRGRILKSKLGLRPEQVAVKPNFTFDALQASIDSNERDNYFLFIGRLSEEKGIETLLNAFKNSSFHLKLVGAGPLEEQVLTATRQSPNIEALGFKNRSEIQALLLKARALILPSICYENFPMTILEAFASGTPTITSRIGGLPDIVIDGETGFLAAPNSPESLLETIHRMSVAPNYAQLCQNARATYLEKYTPEINYQLLMTIYQEAVHDHFATEKKHSLR